MHDPMTVAFTIRLPWPWPRPKYKLTGKDGKQRTHHGNRPEILTIWHVDQLRSLRTIKEVWLSCDRLGVLPALRRAAERLAWLGRRKIRCYVMVGYGGATPAQDLDRLEAVWDAGCLPFAQPYQPPAESRTNSPELRALVREWSRPAAMFANHPKA